MAAPEADNVVDSPTHISVSEATAVTIGLSFTIIAIDVVAVQPFTSVPSTTYVVVVVGETDIVAPGVTPSHRYVDAPSAVSVTASPTHTSSSLA